MKQLMQEVIHQLKDKLGNATQSSCANGMLFSGGLDTSILLSLYNNVKAITVSLEQFGEDSRYAKTLAKNLKIEHHYHKIITVEEAIASIQ